MTLGDLTKPRKLRDKYRGKVWLCYFKRDRDVPEAVKWDPKNMSVYAERSKIIQRVIDDFVDGNIKIYLKPEELIDFIDHWETLYQITEKDSLGIERKKWETEGENHLLFATVYWYLALLRSGNAKIISWQAKEKSRVDNPQSPSPSKMAEQQAMMRGQDWRL